MTHRNWFVGTLSAAILASATLAAQAQSVKKSVDEGDPPPIHGFSVSLVLGDMQGASTPDNLPTGAKKALADLRDFLPFKSYRLLDTQWILCCGSSKGGGKSPAVSGRLRGFEEQLYAFFIDFGYTAPRLSIRFSLREESFTKKLTDAKASQELIDLLSQKQQEKEAIEAVLAVQRKQLGPKHPEIMSLEGKVERLKAETEEKSRALGGKGAVIDSTFSMDVGETVVIGTSSLKADKALIAVLTAARRPGSQTTTVGEKR
jgi:hypothetical protein